MSDGRPRFAAVLPAAGSSSRLGQAKQLVEFEGEPLVCRTARLLRECGADPVIVVCGHAEQEVRRVLKGDPGLREVVRLVSHPEWFLGLASSIGRGCAELPPDTDGVLLMLCDQWRIDAADLDALVHRWLSDISHIVCAEWKTGESLYHGPPAIFPRKTFRELKSIREGAGAKAVMTANRRILGTIRLQNAAADVDTPAALQRMQKAQRM